MDDKSTLASLDAQNQWHDTEENNMHTTRCDYCNDAQGASIEAALQERIESVADAARGGNEVLNQVTRVPALVDLFAGYGWKASMSAKRQKLTPKYLHDRRYMYREEGEMAMGKEASIAPLDNEFYSWVASFFGPLLSEHGDNSHQRDATFLGILTALSAVLHHCYITDKGKELGTSLITFIAGLTGDGKGDVTKPRELLEELDNLLQEKRKYS